MRTSQNLPEIISTIGLDVGKNTFHLACSGPPRGCPPPLCATLAHHIG
jgi:hypothetical protein